MVQYLADIYSAVSSAIKGMGITIKHIYRKPVTLQYPDERWVLPERFKGFVFLDRYKCNACMQCAKACPVSCIYIETEGKGKDRWMTRYAVDYNKCIWCGFCTDPCPTGAVTMSHDYDHSLYFRERLVYHFVTPADPVPTHKEKRAEMGYLVEEKEPAPKKEASAVPPSAPRPEPAAANPGPADAPAPDAPPSPPPAASPAVADPTQEEDKGESQ